jgi:hypothetical protein
MSDASITGSMKIWHEVMRNREQGIPYGQIGDAVVIREADDLKAGGALDDEITEVEEDESDDESERDRRGERRESQDLDNENPAMDTHPDNRNEINRHGENEVPDHGDRDEPGGSHADFESGFGEDNPEMEETVSRVAEIAEAGSDEGEDADDFFA